MKTNTVTMKDLGYEIVDIEIGYDEGEVFFSTPFGGAMRVVIDRGDVSHLEGFDEDDFWGHTNQEFAKKHLKSIEANFVDGELTKEQEDILDNVMFGAIQMYRDQFVDDCLDYWGDEDVNTIVGLKHRRWTKDLVMVKSITWKPSDGSVVGTTQKVFYGTPKGVHEDIDKFQEEHPDLVPTINFYGSEEDYKFFLSQEVA